MIRTATDAKSMKRWPSRRRASLRRLLALPIALALVAAFATSAFAAEPTSGYTHPSTAKHEILPSKSKVAPSKEATTPTTPTSTTPAKASSLPFTGFDLRWTVGFGLVLMLAGGSLVLIQRRQQRSGR